MFERRKRADGMQQGCRKELADEVSWTVAMPCGQSNACFQSSCVTQAQGMSAAHCVPDVVIGMRVQTLGLIVNTEVGHVDGSPRLPRGTFRSEGGQLFATTSRPQFSQCSSIRGCSRIRGLKSSDRVRSSAGCPFVLVAGRHSTSEHW